MTDACQPYSAKVTVVLKDGKVREAALQWCDQHHTFANECSVLRSRNDLIMKDRAIAKLELKLQWTRRWNELLRKKSEDLIDEMAEATPKAAHDYDEGDAKRKGDAT